MLEFACKHIVKIGLSSGYLVEVQVYSLCCRSKLSAEKSQVDVQHHCTCPASSRKTTCRFKQLAGSVLNACYASHDVQSIACTAACCASITLHNMQYRLCSIQHSTQLTVHNMQSTMSSPLCALHVVYGHKNLSKSRASFAHRQLFPLVAMLAASSLPVNHLHTSNSCYLQTTLAWKKVCYSSLCNSMFSCLMRVALDMVTPAIRSRKA